MSEQSWLNEQAQALRLLDTEVAALHAAGFELREDFDGATAERLERVGLRPAAANRVLKAAGVLGSPAPAQPSAPTEIRVAFAAPGVVDQIRVALADIARPGPARVTGLRLLENLGVCRAVVDAEGRPDEHATLEYLGADAPAVDWWGVLRVVPISEVGIGCKLHHPDTGAPLVKGDDLVDWIGLGRDGLIVAAAIYLLGMDAGDSERVVRADVATGGAVAQTAKARLAASPDLRRRAEAIVDGDTQGPETSPAKPASPLRSDLSRAPGSRLAEHAQLLRRLFSEGELRRCVAGFDPDLTSALPGATASLAAVATSAAQLLERRGYASDAAWWRAVINERPRRSSDVLTVAALYGVNL